MTLTDDAVTILISEDRPQTISILPKLVYSLGLFIGRFNTMVTAAQTGMSKEGSTALSGTTGPTGR